MLVYSHIRLVFFSNPRTIWWFESCSVHMKIDFYSLLLRNSLLVIWSSHILGTQPCIDFTAGSPPHSFYVDYSRTRWLFFLNPIALCLAQTYFVSTYQFFEKFLAHTFEWYWSEVICIPYEIFLTSFFGFEVRFHIHWALIWMFGLVSRSTASSVQFYSRTRRPFCYYRCLGLPSFYAALRTLFELLKVIVHSWRIFLMFTVCHAQAFGWRTTKYLVCFDEAFQAIGSNFERLLHFYLVTPISISGLHWAFHSLGSSFEFDLHIISIPDWVRQFLEVFDVSLHFLDLTYSCFPHRLIFFFATQDLVSHWRASPRRLICANFLLHQT